ncbi:MAG: hypothetical protein ACK4S5_08080, partial [Sphingobium yanoikuyae]
GSAATDYTQGRLKMQPDGQHRNYTTLTDVTFPHAFPQRKITSLSFPDIRMRSRTCDATGSAEYIIFRVINFD